MLPIFCHLFGKLAFSVPGTLVLYSSGLESPKCFILVAFYFQDFSLQLLQISFGSVTCGPNQNVEKSKRSGATILPAFIAHLAAIMLFYFYLLQPLVFLLQLIIDFVPSSSFLHCYATSSEHLLWSLIFTGQLLIWLRLTAN